MIKKLNDWFYNHPKACIIATIISGLIGGVLGHKAACKDDK